MTRPGLRLATFSAALFGFTPTGRNWVVRLQSLDGTFSRSWSERIVGVILTATCFFSSGILLGELSKNYSRGSSMLTIGALGLGALLLGLTAYFSATSVGLRYLVKNGTLSAYNSWGQFKWREPLDGLEYVTCTTVKGFMSMKLHWRDRTRTIALVDTLHDALNQSGDT
jgi:hypothetical protein